MPRKPQTETEPVDFQVEQPDNKIEMPDDRLLEAIRVMSEENRRGMLEFAEKLATEIRKPDPDELAKKEEEEERLRKRREQMISMAKREEDMKRLRQSNCGHKRDDGVSTIMGQIHSDGMFHGVCFRCQRETAPRKVPLSMLAQGIPGLTSVRMDIDKMPEPAA